MKCKLFMKYSIKWEFSSCSPSETIFLVHWTPDLNTNGFPCPYSSFMDILCHCGLTPELIWTEADSVSLWRHRNTFSLNSCVSVATLYSCNQQSMEQFKKRFSQKKRRDNGTAELHLISLVVITNKFRRSLSTSNFSDVSKEHRLGIIFLWSSSGRNKKSLLLKRRKKSK